MPIRFQVFAQIFNNCHTADHLTSDFPENTMKVDSAFICLFNKIYHQRSQTSLMQCRVDIYVSLYQMA